MSETKPLTPVDLLNLTFEHNKHREQMGNRPPSSSSSEKNEAGFNIFEEIQFNKSRRLSDSDYSGKVDSQHNMSLLKGNIVAQTSLESVTSKADSSLPEALY